MTDDAKFYIVLLDGKKILIQAKIFERWQQFYGYWPLPIVDPADDESPPEAPRD